LLPVGKDQLYRAETPEEAKSRYSRDGSSASRFDQDLVDDQLGTDQKMKPEIYQQRSRRRIDPGCASACHIYYLDDAKAVLRAGADIIAHGVRDQPVDTAFIEEMKARSACMSRRLT